MDEARNFRGIKTRGVKRANDEMTLTVITHNIKKIDKHVTINVLKNILEEIKKYKIEYGHVDMSIFDTWQDKFIMEDNILVDLKL